MAGVSTITQTATAVTYRIDRGDTIVETGGAWDAFAAANGGVAPVLGRPLWQFVAGTDVRGIWELMLRRVRTTGEPLSFLYRCDAPGLVRVLRMELRPAPDDSVTFVSTVVGERVAAALSGNWSTGSARALVTVCGWCARVRVDGDWQPPEHAVGRLGLLDDRQPPLSHGVCGTCVRELRSGWA